MLITILCCGISLLEGKTIRHLPASLSYDLLNTCVTHLIIEIG